MGNNQQGKTLKLLRMSYGDSVEEFAPKIGLSESTINNLENGSLYASKPLLDKYSLALDIKESTLEMLCMETWELEKQSFIKRIIVPIMQRIIRNGAIKNLSNKKSH